MRGWFSSWAAAPASSAMSACFSRARSSSCASESWASMRRRSRRSVKTPTEPTGSPFSMMSAAEMSTGTRRAVLAQEIGAEALEPAGPAVLARVDERA